MEMTGIRRGSLGALIITVIVLLAISLTSGEEQQLAEARQGPAALQHREVRETKKENESFSKRKKKNGRAKKRRKQKDRKLKKKSKKTKKPRKDVQKKKKRGNKPNKKGTKATKKRNRKGKNVKKKSKNIKKKRNNGKKNKNDKKKNRKNRKKRRKNRKKKRRNGKDKKKKKTSKWKKKKKLRQSSSCQNISCLNNLLLVLKIDKDTVQNFMQQKKRIDKKLNLSNSKKGKSNVTAQAKASLQNSLGGEKALNNNRPVCHGRYNITDAIQGQVMYNNISQCESKVKTACNISMPANETAEVETCNKVMGDFR